MKLSELIFARQWLPASAFEPDGDDELGEAEDPEIDIEDYTEPDFV